MDREELQQTDIWTLFQQGQDYARMIDIFNKTDLNFRMFNGDQNEGLIVEGIEKDKKEIDKDKENLSRIVGIYEENFGVIYPASRNWFIEISEKIDYDLFEEAVKICIDKNNMTTGYLKGIIKKWLKDKIYSLKDYKLKERERQNRKSKLKSAPSSEDMEIDEKLIAEIKAMEEKMEA